VAYFFGHPVYRANSRTHALVGSLVLYRAALMTKFSNRYFSFSCRKNK